MITKLMMKKKDNNRRQLEETVEKLEQILEVMPEDYITLETLYKTLVQLEQPEKAFESLSRLADFALRSKNKEAIVFVVEQYEALDSPAPEIEARIAQLHTLLAGGMNPLDGSSGGSPSREKVPETAGAHDLEAETAMAWNLLHDEQLSQEEYSSVLHDLSELATQSIDVPLSVLHVLHDRQFSRFDRLMTYLSNKTKTPIISLDSYDEGEGLEKILPLEFVIRRGVLPFGFVDGDLLVAILDPFDKVRIADAEKESGRHCHPYLVPPDEYDRRLERLKKTLEE